MPSDREAARNDLPTRLGGFTAPPAIALGTTAGLGRTEASCPSSLGRCRALRRRASCGELREAAAALLFCPRPPPGDGDLAPMHPGSQAAGPPSARVRPSAC